MKSPTLRKWQRLTAEQRDMLREVVAEVSGPNASFQEFAETARSFMESIAGLETLTEREASALVNQLWRDYMAKKPIKAKKATDKPSKQRNQEEVQQKTDAPAAKEAEAPAPLKKIDLTKPAVKKAIEEAQAVLKDGKSKADAAWAIYSRLKDEDKELIVAAFIKGATLTEKGALTYWYNCRKRAAKEVKTP